MSLTEQTKNDLKYVLETIDQRLHEIGSNIALKHEAAALQTLRENAAGMLLEG